MIDPNFIFRSGKHTGKSYVWVEENDPTYITWILENRPQMLGKKAPPKVTVATVEEKLKGLHPNENFLHEGPDSMSIPYLKKMANPEPTKSFFDLDF